MDMNSIIRFVSPQTSLYIFKLLFVDRKAMEFKVKNTTKKVVILENITSPYIHQAIIVLNDYNPSKESKIITDAEKIVNDYLEKNLLSEEDIKIYSNKSAGKKTKKKRYGIIFSALMILSSAAAGYILAVCI